MDILFYLKTKSNDLVSIAYLRNMETNPFKIGDTVLINLKEIDKVKLGRFKKEIQDEIIKEHMSQTKEYLGAKVLITNELKHIILDVLETPNVKIEYHCTLLNN
jgi:S-adenosylmethionine synthetase